MAVLDEMDEGDEMKPEDEREALAVATAALALWNNGRGHHDAAWVFRMASNMADALRQVASVSRVVPVSDEAVARDAKADAETLAKHQRRGTGMTGSSPDSCSCGERVMPAATTGWDDYSDIMDRRDTAFAAHQVAALEAAYREEQQ